LWPDFVVRFMTLGARLGGFGGGMEDHEEYIISKDVVFRRRADPKVFLDGGGGTRSTGARCADAGSCGSSAVV